MIGDSVVEEHSPLLAVEIEIEVLERAEPADRQAKRDGKRAAARGSLAILVPSFMTAVA